MLKITTRTDPTGTSLELEGKLAGPWVQELEGCWQEIARSERSVRVLLGGVTFIDTKGRQLLIEMHRRGAELVAEGCMNKAIIDEIARGK
jgi:ABC-type transporter Mla MlaB component